MNEVARAKHLRPAERKRQEDRVARRDVGRGNLVRIDRPVLGHRLGGRQRGAAERGQVDVELDVPRDAERRRHGARRLQLARVPLTVADRQREEAEAVRPRDRRGRVGIEAAAEQDDGDRASMSDFC